MQTGKFLRNENNLERSKTIEMKKYIQREIMLITAFCLLLGNTAFAYNPPFARTEEEWQSLRDNRLEYGEIKGLIREYNATVQQNHIDLIQFKKDYGKTNSKVSDAYKDMANDILENITEPDPDSMTYAAAAASALQARTQADNLLKTADETMEDSEVFRLDYENTEMQLVQSTQNNMIAYYDKLWALDKARTEHQIAELDLALANVRLRAGTITHMEVLNAQEALLKSTQAITDAESEINKVKQILMVSCGWQYNAAPEFGELPEPDTASIEKMNPEQDKEKAWENNYTLRSNERKLGNARNESQKEKLNTSIANNRSNISAALVVAYQNVIAARDAYLYANSNKELQDKNLQIANSKFSVGMISQEEMKKQEALTISAGITLKQSKIALLQAINAYEWAVNGLAKAN